MIPSTISSPGATRHVAGGGRLQILSAGPLGNSPIPLPRWGEGLGGFGIMSSEYPF
jgi:hypothetical protein